MYIYVFLTQFINYIFLDNNESNSHNTKLIDMNDQEQQLAEMTYELANLDCGVATFKLFLQYVPDAITYLFDKCLVMHNDSDQVKP